MCPQAQQELTFIVSLLILLAGVIGLMLLTFIGVKEIKKRYD